MIELKQIGILSLAKLQAIVMGVFGLLMGLIYGIVGLVFGISSGSTGMGIGLGLLAIIGLPIIYAIFGFVAGAVGALIYNLAAKTVGGIELDLTQHNEQTKNE